MPRARVSPAKAVKPGFFRNRRKAKRRSLIFTMYESLKRQKPNTKLQGKLKLQIPNGAEKSPYWSLGFEFLWSLMFGISSQCLHLAARRYGPRKVNVPFHST